jgi:tetratricopeptide (TPR) repeat protein
VKAKARVMLTRAGERAAALAASEEAQRYFEQALELTDDAATRAGLRRTRGQMALLGGSSRSSQARTSKPPSPRSRLIGETHASARVSARLGEVDYPPRAPGAGHRAHGVGLSRFSRTRSRTRTSATLAAQLGRLHVFSGAHELAARRLEFALGLAESLRLAEQLSQALNTKAVLLTFQSRHEEAMALVRHALSVALDNDLSAAAVRAYNNLGAFLFTRDRYDEVRALMEPALELARRIGDRNFELWLVAGQARLAAEAGEWEEARRVVDEIRGSGELSLTASALLLFIVPVFVNQGKLDQAHEILDGLSELRYSEELQSRSQYAWAESVLFRAEGDFEAALTAASRSTQSRHEIGIASVKVGLVEELEAAMSIDRAKAGDLVSDLERLRPGESTPFLAAHAARFRARLSPAGAEQGFASALAGFRELAMPFWIAVTLLEQAEWLTASARGVEAAPMLVEAEEIFDRLHARPWQDRLAQLTKIDSVSA